MSTKTGTAVAAGLQEAFHLSEHVAAQLATLLGSGQVQLRTSTFAVRPFVGPAPEQLQAIRRLAQTGSTPARRELDAIRQYHQTTRFDVVAAFLAQFPVQWRVLLLMALRHEVVRVTFDVDGAGRVVAVRTWSDADRFEYSLRWFNLTFAQVVDISGWMAEHAEELTAVRSVTLPQGESPEVNGRRWAALMTFFDALPEDYRNLLAKKIVPQARVLQFVTSPTGVVLQISA
jgi:hypothetical protein